MQAAAAARATRGKGRSSVVSIRFLTSSPSLKPSCPVQFIILCPQTRRLELLMGHQPAHQPRACPLCIMPGQWTSRYRSENKMRRDARSRTVFPAIQLIYLWAQFGRRRNSCFQKRDVIRFSARFSLKVQVSRGVESLAALTVQEGDIHQPTSWSRGRKDTFI